MFRRPLSSPIQVIQDPGFGPETFHQAHSGHLEGFGVQSQARSRVFVVTAVPFGQRFVRPFLDPYVIPYPTCLS